MCYKRARVTFNAEYIIIERVLRYARKVVTFTAEYVTLEQVLRLVQDTLYEN